MSPGQRLILQTGYEALRNSGVSRLKAHGLSCGVFLGDSGCDWPQLFGQAGRGVGELGRRFWGFGVGFLLL